MSMLPIIRIVVAALLLTGTTATLVPDFNNTTATTPTAIVSTTEGVTQLTAEEATAIALADAGLTLEEVTGMRTRLERDDGILHWDVEFCSDAYAFEYEIHGKTGVILERDRERLRTGTQPSTPPATTEPSTPPATTEPAPAELTREEALAIALNHAGLTQEEVTRVQIQRDREDGIWIYEIEFRAGRMEYEYEIHAETGKILQSEKELDD